MSIYSKLMVKICFILLCFFAVSTQAQKDKKLTFTDNRDGKTYEYTNVGFQVWMAENLNYNVKNSYAYDKDSENSKTYGRLYNWETAQNVCPNGWHLPSVKEWEILISQLGGKNVAASKLKGVMNFYWQGDNKKSSNAVRFWALPGGFGLNENVFSGMGNESYFQTSSQADENYSYLIYLKNNSTRVFFSKFYKSTLLSVRCVKDIDE